MNPIDPATINLVAGVILTTILAWLIYIIDKKTTEVPTMHKSNFLDLVAKERTRQIVEKGYSPEHDDEHTDGEIADAAACYASENKMLYGDDYSVLFHGGPSLKGLWPWDEQYFKKEDHDRKQQLIIAAAFINAEYDRIVRAEQKDSRCRGCNYLLSKDANAWCALTGMSMDEYDTRCEQYCLPPFETSEVNPLLTSFNRSSYE